MRAHAGFDERAFIADASAGLNKLELIDRGRHIATALAKHLPPAYPEALDVLLRSLGPELPGDEILGVGMAPFFYLPYTLFIAERGVDHFELSMQAQRELTKRMSCEGSIRPYIHRYPEETFGILRKWARDPNPHVRRLVSEGTRLRLPWAMRVAWLDAHPKRVVELLEMLKDDSSPMVRRSVANNLNDLGKAHPKLLVATCSAWRGGKDVSAERRAVVEHALRSAVKRGEPGALKLLGYGGKPAVAVERVRFEPKRVTIGGSVAMSFVLRSTSKKSQDLLVDVSVHFVKANGKASPKVFKLERVALPPDGKKEMHARFSLAVHTTRKPRPGVHEVDVIVNGVAMPAGSFNVVAGAR